MTKLCMKNGGRSLACAAALSVTLGFLAPIPVSGQQTLPLTDLSGFTDPGKSWQIVGDVKAELEKPNTFKVTKGAGILVNLPAKKAPGINIRTVQEHADLDLELDYMTAAGSNSGIYFQGRYELQILDSWGVQQARSGDNGGIYERWDESRGKGQEGFQGHAPRQNASRAPGLWQHLKVVFQAPRFDAGGRKIQNARFLKVELNGVTIHENLELHGPTRAALGNGETASGPLLIQGDHGAVAFRNIRLKNYNKARPELSEIQYTLYNGKFETLPDFDTLQVVAAGTTPLLTSTIINPGKDALVLYTGEITIRDEGEYKFDFSTPGGSGALKVNNQTVQEFGSSESRPIRLSPGRFPFELVYAKTVSWWQQPSFSLQVSHPDIRSFLISDPNAVSNDAADPILVDVSTTPILRSFMDIPGGKRVVHAVNVGSRQQLHYTYDLDHGALVQIWRGGFLDATPMWNSRGDGSSRPLGSKLVFGDPVFTIRQLDNPQAAWNNDSSGTGFFIKGYELDNGGNPTFKYRMYGATVTDAVQAYINGKEINRMINVENAPTALYVLLAADSQIENLGKGLYLIGDKSYYVRINNPSGEKPLIRESAGKKELIVPIQTALSYSILY